MVHTRKRSSFEIRGMRTSSSAPGPGAIGCIEPGIWRDMPGRSSESSGAGMEPEVCCRQRSTLMLTPGCFPSQSRDESPFRSEPV